MIMRNVFIAAALIAAAFVSCGPKYAEPTSTPGSKIAYSMSFIRNVAANVDKNENIVISPYSAGVALSMLAEGAEGQTKEEFNKALNACIFKAENLGGNDTVIVNSVNSLWVDDDFSIRNRYLFLLQKDFIGEIIMYLLSERYGDIYLDIPGYGEYRLRFVSNVRNSADELIHFLSD